MALPYCLGGCRRAPLDWPPLIGLESSDRRPCSPRARKYGVVEPRLPPPFQDPQRLEGCKNPYVENLLAFPQAETSFPPARGAGGRLGLSCSLLTRLAARGPLPARPLLPRLLSTNLERRVQIEFLFSFHSTAALRSSSFFPMTVLPEKVFASTTPVSPQTTLISFWPSASPAKVCHLEWCCLALSSCWKTVYTQFLKRVGICDYPSCVTLPFSVTWCFSQHGSTQGSEARARGFIGRIMSSDHDKESDTDSNSQPKSSKTSG